MGLIVNWPGMLQQLPKTSFETSLEAQMTGDPGCDKDDPARAGRQHPEQDSAENGADRAQRSVEVGVLRIGRAASSHRSSRTGKHGSSADGWPTTFGRKMWLAC